MSLIFKNGFCLTYVLKTYVLFFSDKKLRKFSDCRRKKIKNVAEKIRNSHIRRKEGLEKFGERLLWRRLGSAVAGGVESLKNPRQISEEECFDAGEFRGNLSLLKGILLNGNRTKHTHCQYDRNKEN